MRSNHFKKSVRIISDLSGLPILLVLQTLSVFQSLSFLQVSHVLQFFRLVRVLSMLFISFFLVQNVFAENGELSADSNSISSISPTSVSPGIHDNPNFFSENQKNIESHPEEFLTFLKDKGVTVIRADSAPLTFSFSDDGTITSQVQKVNVYDLKDLFNFKINQEGEIELIEKNGKSHSFVGSLSKKSNGLFMESGSIDGLKIINGEGIVLNNDVIGLKTSVIGGVTFEGSQNLEYDTQKKIITLENAKIRTVLGNVGINGKNVELPQGILSSGVVEYEDGMVVLINPNSKVTVDGWVHSTLDKPLVLHKISSKTLDAIDGVLQPKRELFLKDMEEITANIKLQEEILSKKHRELDQITKGRIRRLTPELIQLQDQLGLEETKLKDAKNLYWYKRDLLAQVERDMRKRHKEEYAKMSLVNDLPKNSNFFLYGSDIIYAGGDSFSSSITPKNSQFPNPSVKNSRPVLEFTLEGGEVIIEPTSETGSAQSLHIDGKGSFQLKNGPWTSRATGRDFLVSPFVKKDNSRFIDAYDVEVAYTPLNGNKKNVEFNTFAEYSAPLPILERVKYQGEIDVLQARIKKNSDLFEGFSKNPEHQKILAEYGVIEEQYNQLESERAKAAANMFRVERSLQNPKANVKDLTKQSAQFKAEYNHIAEQSDVSFAKLGAIALKNPQVIAARSEIQKSKSAVKDIQDILGYDIGPGQVGYVSEVKIGNSELSFPDYVTNIPVERGISAEYYHESTRQFSRQQDSTHASYVRNVGSNQRDIPLYKPNVGSPNGFILRASDDTRYDMLSSSQTCSDIQMACYIDYQKELVDRGVLSKIVVPGSNFMWHKGENLDQYKLKVFNSVNSGMVKQALPIVNEAKHANAGDILVKSPDSSTGYGHTIGIKREMSINGKRYFQLFQGSDPARDPEINSALLSETELQRWIDGGRTTVHKWPVPSTLVKHTD